ncbi:hypothetical protein AVEN_104908-1 [Araneus ventricosus]|uniref:Histone-lysine N-methyltransferase SETMAR n=1 Tax=Araneus ventricosus TaxID=182803 RepID=A0A4Y2WK43_ARAVE|nr:hypothetical protein AVEN_104908-1 [Araneus ventricosus]
MASSTGSLLQFWRTRNRGLRKAPKNKRRGKLRKGFLHHNTRPHKALTTQGLLRSFGWEVWQQLPYSPDLSPCDFHVFGKIKEHLGGRQLSNDDQVQTAVLSYLQDQGAIFYRQGIERIVQRSDKCLQRLGDYVDK